MFSKSPPSRSGTTSEIPISLNLFLKAVAFFEEGLENRYARHARLAEMAHDWAERRGFTLFSEEGFASLTLTCINNGAKDGGRIVDVPRLQELVKEKGILIDGSYGKLKGTTFRLSNMGDETDSSMGDLYSALDWALERL